MRVAVSLVFCLTLGLSVAPSATSAETAGWASVVQVVDPATLNVDVGGTTEAVHLLGIADGINGSAEPGVTACLSAAALNRTRDLVGTQSVRLEPDPAFGDPDPLGRKLAYVWLPDGSSLGEVLLREGLVRTQLTSQPYVHEAAYAAAQAGAVVDGVGSWAPGACPALDPPVGLQTFVSSMIEQARVAKTALDVLHQQTLTAGAYGPALSQPAWRQGTQYGLAELRGSAVLLQSAASAPPAVVLPLSQRLAAVGSDLTAGADAYTLGVDRQDAALIGAADTQLHTSAMALQPLLEELLAVASAYALGD